MRKNLKLLIIGLLSALLLIGCSQNDRGTWGPAWDLALDIPLIGDEKETVAEMLEDVDDLDLSGEVVKFSYQDEIEEVDFGSELDKVTEDLPEFNDTISFGAIEVPAIEELPSIEGIKIVGGLTGDEGLSDLDDQPEDFSSIEFTMFEKIVFSNNDSNKMKVTVTNSEGHNVKVKSLTLTFKSGDEIIGEKVTIKEINSGDSKYSYWDLREASLGDRVDIEFSIETSEDFEQGEIDIEFSFEDDIEVEKVTDLAIDNINDSITETVKIEEFPAGVENISFASGNLALNIVGLEETGLKLNLESFELINDEQFLYSKDGKINLAGKAINLGENLEFKVKASLLAEGTINYDSANSKIDVIGGFNDVQIASIDINLAQFDLEDINGTIEEDSIEVPEELFKVEFSDDVELELFLEGLEDLGISLDLSEVTFTAYDEGENPIEGKSFNLGEVNDKVSLTAEDSDLLDLLTTEGVDTIKYGGDYSIKSEGTATITSDTKVKISLNAQIPIQLTLKENIEHRLDPEEMDSLTSDEVEIIEEGIKSARLRGQINNQLPVGITLEFYVGSVSNYDDDDGLKDQLYQEENKLATRVELKRRTNDENFEVVFDTKEANRFKEDNLYVGAKVIIPEGEMTLDPDDYIQIKNLRASLVYSVNQRDLNK
ncbi:hypothetical protein [Halonatronum saccharophilum]|uniref:hypothetical protein n=1 Tax=Halonatronum saccharophilum TaxID=150060 RepID=UPI00048603FB|nr:hypothetical protein [Halonatronum saccharophilum]